MKNKGIQYILKTKNVMAKTALAGVAAAFLGFPTVPQAMEHDASFDMAVDTAPVASIEAPASAVKAEAPIESVVRYKAHRSPVRTDSLAIHVVTLDTQEEVQVELPGIEGLSFNTVCRTAEGARLACGSRARIQFVNLVARRDIACKFMATPDQGAKVQSCQVEGKDLGEWLVRNGIGRPTGEGLHVAALREARQSERGMWADAETRNGVQVARN